MQGHPGGKAHTEHMIALAHLPSGSRWLDFGAGNGEAIRILRESGFQAQGVDLRPRGPEVTEGDFLQTEYPTGSFDGILSQCALFASENSAKALLEAGRLLRQGGILAFSDVCFDEKELIDSVHAAGFSIIHREDLTAVWRDYFLEALWKEEVTCSIPKGKCSYLLLICERM